MKSVYVGNLPYATTDNELKALFEPFGQVYGARIKTDRDTGRPLGYGFVQMDDAAAAKAIEALDGKDHAGRVLRVNESRERSSGDRPPRRDGAGRPSGDRPPRRDFNGSRPPRPAGEHPFRHGPGDRPPRPASGFTPAPARTEEYDPEADDDGSDYTPSGDFGGNDRPRRRPFRKNDRNQYGRDKRDGDRPRRPFVKVSPRKKGYRPNEDYESEEE
ncbi:MAG: RNA-binding protein [Lentisphaeria bacterium]|nr:RNA-binding protein [Lentisphaeria bacterium]